MFYIKKKFTLLKSQTSYFINKTTTYLKVLIIQEHVL